MQSIDNSKNQTPRLVKTITEIKQLIKAYKQQNKKIGFVPTMGALHNGHLSLVKCAKEETDIVIVSIFVNPTQFGEGEDYDKYPRTLDSDLKKLSNLANIVFAPSVDEIYNIPYEEKNNEKNFEYRVIEKNYTNILCGKFRKGHFDGVLTIVLKLFNIITPDIAYFGLKDYQQYVLIKQMTKYFNLSLEIKGCPLIREDSGIALSSRNSYLDKVAKDKALKISKFLHTIIQEIKKGKITNVSTLKEKALEFLLPDVIIQYIEVTTKNLHKKGLKDIIEPGDVILIAGFVRNQDGTITRLIDNIVYV